MDEESQATSEPADGRLTVVVGVLGKAHALKGEVELVTGADDPAYLIGRAFGTPAGPLTVEGIRRHHDKVLVRFSEVADRTTAEELRGVELRIPAEERRTLDEGEWWPEDLVGLEVVDRDGSRLGSVVDVVTGGPQDRLVVDGGGEDFDVPFVAALVPEVDLDRGRVVVDLPDGLVR